jgi:hypothetical protein
MSNKLHVHGTTARRGLNILNNGFDPQKSNHEGATFFLVEDGNNEYEMSDARSTAWDYSASLAEGPISIVEARIGDSIGALYEEGRILQVDSSDLGKVAIERVVLYKRDDPRLQPIPYISASKKDNLIVVVSPHLDDTKLTIDTSVTNLQGIWDQFKDIHNLISRALNEELNDNGFRWDKLKGSGVPLDN